MFISGKGVLKILNAAQVCVRGKTKYVNVYIVALSPKQPAHLMQS